MTSPTAQAEQLVDGVAKWTNTGLRDVLVKAIECALRQAQAETRTEVTLEIAGQYLQRKGSDMIYEWLSHLYDLAKAAEGEP